MKVIGLRTNMKAKDLNAGLMVACIRVNLMIQKRMDMEFTSGLTETNTLEIGRTMKFMVKESTYGVMVSITLEIGLKTKCMVKESINGQMGVCIVENTIWIRNME